MLKYNQQMTQPQKRGKGENMKSLLLNRKRINCYSTGFSTEIDGFTIELYANTSNFRDGQAIYYIDSIGTNEEIQELGKFENLEDAEKSFNLYCNDLKNELED